MLLIIQKNIFFESEVYDHPNVFVHNFILVKRLGKFYKKVKFSYTVFLSMPINNQL